jgi:hypothetical protein
MDEFDESVLRNAFRPTPNSAIIRLRNRFRRSPTQGSPHDS